MEFQRDKVLANIHNCTPQTLEFIEEWCDGNPYVTAHTSGSTGKPKAIGLLKSDMIASAESTNRYFNINEKSTLLCPLSADYIAGKMMIVRAMVSGAKLYMEIPSNMPVQYDYGKIDLIAVVPSQMPHILENEAILNRLGSVLIGGSSVTRELAAGINMAGVNAFVSYGMTETCSHVALRKIDNTSDETYEAMPDIYFSQDERNCLVINSDFRSFGKLVTNDIVALTDNKHFRWVGRYDNVINSGGIKVYPEDIEQQIGAVMPVGVEFYIAQSSDLKWGEVPIIVISKLIDDMDGVLERARSVVRSKAERPVRIIVDEIAHTASGKIIRRRFE